MVDLTDVGGWIKRIVRRLDRLEGGAMLENASITNGRVRFIGGKLQGLAGAVFEWVGSIVTKGPWTNEGKFTNTGELEQNGTSNFNGDVFIKKKLDVTAETTLRKLVTLLENLLVEGDGQITVAGVIDMLFKNGMITYANGATIAGSAGGVTIDSGSAQLQVATLVAALIAGPSSIRVEGTGTTVEGNAAFQDRVNINGLLFAAGISYAPIAGAVSGTLVMDGTTQRVYAAI